MNNMHPNLKFKFQLENNNSLKYLELTLKNILINYDLKYLKKLYKNTCDFPSYTTRKIESSTVSYTDS